MSKGTESKPLLWFRSALAGEQCASCGQYDTHGLSLLCPECEQSLIDSFGEKCPLCGKNANACLCMTEGMKECGAAALIKLGIYDALDKNAALNRIILRLKDIPDRMLADKMADYLSVTLTDYIETNGLDRERMIFTYIPRSKNRLIETGTDQAKLLSRAIAAKGGFQCWGVIRRSNKKAAAQKALNASQRISNVSGQYSISNGKIVFGKIAVLVDDLVTTGSTMKECVKILMNAGATQVICMCIGRSSYR